MRITYPLSIFVTLLFTILAAATASAGTGEVEIVSEPGDAVIFINDKPQGNTPALPGQMFLVTLKAAKYHLRLFKEDGDYEYVGEKTLYVGDNTAQTVQVSLKRRKTAAYEARLKEEIAEKARIEAVAKIRAEAKVREKAVRLKKEAAEKARGEVTAKIRAEAKAWEKAARLKKETEKKARAEAREKTARLRIDFPPIEPEMIRIPGGSFRMGCVSGQNCLSSEEPVHKVTLSSFSMGKYEVTFEEWDRCAAHGVCTRSQDDGPGRGQRAVNNVSWEDVQKYIGWLNRETGKNYRLPTEAEWEYAARVETTTKYSFGNSANNLGDYGWYDDIAFVIGDRYAHKVGKKQPNPWGLYDMHGNVSEWCQDWYDKKYYSISPGMNPVNSAKGSNRVLRGGSWSCSADGCRSAGRDGSSPSNRFTDCGFRLVLSSSQ